MCQTARGLSPSCRTPKKCLQLPPPMFPLPKKIVARVKSSLFVRNSLSCFTTHAYVHGPQMCKHFVFVFPSLLSPPADWSNSVVPPTERSARCAHRPAPPLLLSLPNPGCRRSHTETLKMFLPNCYRIVSPLPQTETLDPKRSSVSLRRSPFLSALSPSLRSFPRPA